MLSSVETVVAPTEHSVRDIVHAHGKHVWRLLRYLGVAPADLEDVCQEVFTTVYRKRADLMDDGIRPWLRAICVNHARNYRRKIRNRRETLVDEIPDLVVAAPQEGTIEVAEGQKLVLQLLNRMDEDLRTILVLYSIEELPMEDIIKLVGCPRSTAYLRLQRARTEFAKLVEEAS